MRLIFAAVLIAALLPHVQVGAQCKPVQTHKLLADDGAKGDQFGDSVAVNGNMVIVGANLDDDNGEN